MSKTESTKKYKLNPFAIVALVLCAAVAIYCGTTAWITSGAPVNPLRLIQLQDFNYIISVSDKNKSFDTSDSIELDYNDVESLESLNISVTQQGSGVAFVRIKLSHEWKLADGSRLQGELNLPFIASNSGEIIDNREVDGYIYYVGDFPVDQAVEIISGFDVSKFDTSALTNYGDDLTLSLDVTVDAVQFNRYRQVWGIDVLPWRG